MERCRRYKKLWGGGIQQGRRGKRGKTEEEGLRGKERREERERQLENLAFIPQALSLLIMINYLPLAA